MTTRTTSHLQIIDRRTAHTRGFKRFFTGKPCRRGHVSERYVSNAACVECLTMTSHNFVQTQSGVGTFAPDRVPAPSEATLEELRALDRYLRFCAIHFFTQDGQYGHLEQKLKDLATWLDGGPKPGLGKRSEP